MPMLDPIGRRYPPRATAINGARQLLPMQNPHG
jgi:hypothetical protein